MHSLPLADRMWVYGDLIIIHPKPCFMYFRGAIIRTCPYASLFKPKSGLLSSQYITMSCLYSRVVIIAGIMGTIITVIDILAIITTPKP